MQNKRIGLVFSVLLMALLMPTGCQHSSGEKGDSDSSTTYGQGTDSGVGSTDISTSSTGTSADGSVATDSTVTVSTDATDRDTQSAAMDSEGHLTAQPPIQLIVRNATSHPVYLPVDATAESAFKCQKNSGQTCYFFRPYCADSCEDVSTNANCMMSCEYWPMMQPLNPGVSLAVVWPGTLFEYVADYCQDGGRCSREVETPFRPYSVSITAYSDFSCFVNDDCDIPNDTGLLSAAEPKGDGKTVTAAFTIPESDNIELVITE